MTAAVPWSAVMAQVGVMLDAIPAGADLRIRCRVYVDRQLVTEHHWSPMDSDPSLDGHLSGVGAAAIIRQAQRDGSVWLIEYHCPGAPEHLAYVRFGTDVQGMHDPVMVRVGE